MLQVNEVFSDVDGMVLCAGIQQACSIHSFTRSVITVVLLSNRFHGQQICCIAS